MAYARHLRRRWRTALVAEIFVIASFTGFGCATRVVLVPSGEPVRLRETIRDAKVWVADKDGKEIPAVADLPEGWYALPDPGPSDENDRR